MFAAMTISRIPVRGLALLGAGLMSLGALTSARASEDLARQKACLACHQIGKPVLGPAFIDVARKHRGDKQAAARLAEKIRKGGGGAWNMPMGPMPAQGQVSEAEARQLTAWILAIR